MRQLIAIAFFVLFANTAQLFAQWGVGFQDDFTERSCPYDTTVTGLFPNTMEVFQTLDNTYDGQVDSSWCPVFVQNGTNRIELDLDTYDFSRPLFVRVRLPEDFASPILPYVDYDLYDSGTLRYLNRLNSGDCPNDCSQIHLRYRAVDNLTLDTIYRDFEFDSPNYSRSSCFFSERFQTQKVTEIGETLWLARDGVQPRIYFIGYGLSPVSSPEFPEFRRRAADSILFTEVQLDADNVYRAFPSEVVEPAPAPDNPAFYYAPQFEDRIPGPSNIRYLEANVAGDPTTVASLELNFAEYNDIALPPYAGLAGAKVAGQDSLRHELTIVFDDFYRGSCTFSVSTDRPLLQNTFFEFGTTEIYFAEDAACFVLESGSGLSVRSGKNLQYGSNGQGLLAAKQESKINIAPGATFTFNNTLRLLHPISFPEGGMHVYLAEGSTLRFGEMANVERKFIESNVWIYVHGKEENVDFGPLTPEERALFVFVDAPVYLFPAPLEEVHFYPNPGLAGTTLSLLFPRLESEGEKAFALYSSQGKVIVEGRLLVDDNRNAQVNLPAHLAEGIYFLRVTGEQRNYSVNVVVRSIP